MSSIPAVEAALVEVLTAALPEVQVIDASRDSVSVTKSAILTFGDVQGVREFTDMANAGGTEQYTIPWTIAKAVPGSAIPKAQVLDWFEAACVAINAHDFSAAAPNGRVKATGEFRFQTLADKDGREAAVKSSVEVFVPF